MPTVPCWWPKDVALHALNCLAKSGTVDCGIEWPPPSRSHAGWRPPPSGNSEIDERFEVNEINGLTLIITPTPGVLTNGKLTVG